MATTVFMAVIVMVVKHMGFVSGFLAAERFAANESTIHRSNRSTNSDLGSL